MADTPPMDHEEENSRDCLIIPGNANDTLKFPKIEVYLKLQFLLNS